MEINIKKDLLDRVILFNRREVQLRFLEKELYLELFKLCPEYFDVIQPIEVLDKNIKPRKWSDIFEETPLFKISKKK